ncbi:Acg family FMN-binding oxidoreductase [Streptomyces sp. NPDC003860]
MHPTPTALPEARPLDTALVTSLVEDATLAPSMHNAQPWSFGFTPATRTFRLRADRSRAMPQSDPDGRALLIGCAAAVFNLRVAAVHAGWDPVTRLLPDPADPDLLAEVELVRRPPESYDELAELHPALRRRHTSRAPFRDERIEDSLLDVLRRAALLEGARLAFPDAFHRRTILELSSEAMNREQAEPGHREETARWTEGPGREDVSEEGIPRYAFGPRSRSGGAPMRDFESPDDTYVREWAAFEESPQLALLGTVFDHPVDWLRAGQAMERVLLEATLDGLATSVASQALEWSDLRWAVRDPAAAMGHVHMVIRLGYGPQGPSTHRRPTGEVLTIG